MNLRVLQKSRRPPRSGDVFAVLPPTGRYRFGRVIATDAEVTGAGGPLVLIYIYAKDSSSMEEVPELERDRLLVPPLITNRLGWTRGYFRHLYSDELRKEDVLPQHRFRSLHPETPDLMFDEYDRPARPGPGPVGDHGVHSFRTIDDAISDALGIPGAHE